MANKKYGMDGYTEYTAEIRTGKARLSVHFTGGAESGFGRVPASYTTSDPVKQAIIENSPQFRSGRIRLLVGEPIAKRAARPVSRPRVPEVRETPAPPPVVAAGENDGAEEPSPGGVERIECAAVGDAQAVLRERFGIPSSKAGSKEKAMKLGRENGIEFVFA